MTSPDVHDDPPHRLFRRLVENLAALDITALTQPVPIADIHERLVPYRTHRVALGLDTAEDYELALLRLLAGEGGLVTTFPEEVREAFARELAGVNPEPGLFRQFPDASVLLEPEQVAAVRGGGAPVRPAPLTAYDEPVTFVRSGDAAAFAAADDEPDAADRPPFLMDDGDTEEAPPAAQPRTIGAGAPCSYCGDLLPVGRAVLFCPHCGQNVGVVHCATCGAELDVGWQFCITCGQRATGLG